MGEVGANLLGVKWGGRVRANRLGLGVVGGMGVGGVAGVHSHSLARRFGLLGLHGLRARRLSVSVRGTRAARAAPSTVG